MIEEEIYDGCCPYCGEDDLIRHGDVLPVVEGVIGSLMHCTNCGRDFIVKRKFVDVVEVEL